MFIGARPAAVAVPPSAETQAVRPDPKTATVGAATNAANITARRRVVNEMRQRSDRQSLINAKRGLATPTTAAPPV